MQWRLDAVEQAWQKDLSNILEAGEGVTAAARGQPVLSLAAFKYVTAVASACPSDLRTPHLRDPSCHTTPHAQYSSRRARPIVPAACGHLLWEQLSPLPLSASAAIYTWSSCSTERLAAPSPLRPLEAQIWVTQPPPLVKSAVVPQHMLAQVFVGCQLCT